MASRNYFSRHVSQEIACWLSIELHRLDTHAYFSATLNWRHDADRIEHSLPFIRDWFCPRAILLDWIKRDVATRIEERSRTASDVIQPDAREELRRTVDASAPFMSMPLSGDATEYHRQYRDPSPDLWYEIVIDHMSDAAVGFSIGMLGQKYVLEGLSAPRDVFYLLGDKLDARLRFLPSWSAVEEPVRNVRALLDTSPALAPVRAELEAELAAGGPWTEMNLDRGLRGLFPLFERMLRLEADRRGWTSGGLTLAGLVQQFQSAKAVSEGTAQMVAFAIKPYRDAVVHGHTLPVYVGRLALVALLESFVRCARDLDTGGATAAKPKV